LPATKVSRKPAETWEDWSEREFLAPEGSVLATKPLAENVLSEAREVLSDAEDGCHLHLHEEE